MMGAITLTLRARPNVRRQNVSRQHARRKEDGVEIVKVESGKGIA
jgi:NADH-quinone oxidoreductase subunit J